MVAETLPLDGLLLFAPPLVHPNGKTCLRTRSSTFWSLIRSMAPLLTMLCIRSVTSLTCCVWSLLPNKTVPPDPWFATTSSDAVKPCAVAPCLHSYRPVVNVATSKSAPDVVSWLSNPKNVNVAWPVDALWCKPLRDYALTSCWNTRGLGAPFGKDPAGKLAALTRVIAERRWNVALLSDLRYKEDGHRIAKSWWAMCLGYSYIQVV